MPKRIIHFRSFLIGKYETGDGGKSRLSQSGETHSIRRGDGNDDIRDIAWKQTARTGEVAVLSRHETKSLNILLIGIEDESWDFVLEDTHPNKKSFYTQLQRELKSSSELSRYRFDEKYFQKNLETLRVENTLICIVFSTLESGSIDKIRELSHQNDIICIHLLHPYEVSPENYPDTLVGFAGVGLGYREELDEKLRTLRQELLSMHTTPLFLDTSVDITERLNHFFKHRYGR